MRSLFDETEDRYEYLKAMAPELAKAAQNYSDAQVMASHGIPFGTAVPASADSTAKIKPCDLPQDHPEFDPFDWGDTAPVAPNSKCPDMKPYRMSEMLKDYESFARELTEKERHALEKSFSKTDYFFGLAMKHLGQMYPGYLWTKQEQRVVTGQYTSVKRDWMGFADVLGTRKPETLEGPPFVAGQITSDGQIPAHIRKYVSDATSGDEQKTYDKLSAFLSTGSVFIVLGYYKEMIPTTGRGAKPGDMKISGWQFLALNVTPRVLSAAIARKLGTKAEQRSKKLERASASVARKRKPKGVK